MYVHLNAYSRECHSPAFPWRGVVALGVNKKGIVPQTVGNLKEELNTTELVAVKAQTKGEASTTEESKGS